MSNLPALQVISLQEWETQTFEGLFLKAEDRALIDSLSGESDSRIGIDEMLRGLRLSARSWVGVIRFTAFELRIVPKLAGDDIGLLRLVDFTTGMGALDRHPADHAFNADGSSLFDLVVLLMTEAAERIVRSGLLADYKTIEDDLSVMRGSLRVREQIVKRFGRVDRLECRFDEHTTDSIDNQLLLAALSVAVRWVADQGVALRVRRLLGVFEEACTLDNFDLRSTRYSVHYTRLNEQYRVSHQLAWLIFDGLGLNDLYAGGKHRTFAFLLDMSRLFEDFVTRWITMLLRNTSLVAMPQRRDRTILWNADLDRPYASVIPDIVIAEDGSPNRFLSVDAKYKLYDDRKISTGDIYQNFMYAFVYGHSTEQLPRGLILYPSMSEFTPSQRLHVRRVGKKPDAEITAIGVNLPAALDEANERRRGPIGAFVLKRICETFPTGCGDGWA